MHLLTRVKRALAPKIKAEDISTHETCGESNTGSQLGRALKNFGKLRSKIGKGVNKLRGRPAAETPHQSTSCCTHLALPLIDPEVTRSFSDEVLLEFQSPDVEPKEASPSTSQLIPNEFIRRTSTALPASLPSSSATENRASSLPKETACFLSSTASSQSSSLTALVKKESFSSIATICPPGPGFSVPSSIPVEPTYERHLHPEEDTFQSPPILPPGPTTLSRPASIPSSDPEGNHCVTEPAPLPGSAPSVDAASAHRSLPDEDASQPLPLPVSYSSSSSSGGPTHSPVSSAPSSASSMPNEAAPANDSDGRAQWGKMKDIADDAFQNLLKYVLPKERKIIATRVRGRTRGAYHLVVFVDGLEEDMETEQKFVVKVPAHGTSQNWTVEDEYMLVQEAEMLKYLYQNTSLPTSEITDYSPRVDNGWGFPYIVMTRLPGKSAVEIWFDKQFDFTKKHQVHDLADPVLEKTRVNFLRSLAHEMTKLKHIPFNAIGMPSLGCLDQNSSSVALPVDKSYDWPSGIDPHYIEERIVCRSAQEYTSVGMDRWQPVPTFKDNGEHTDETMENMGMCLVLETVFAHSVFQSTPDDTFFLQHNDLDLQNILVDDDGNITGIIDWDGSLAVPRCVAHAAVPAFLRRDWFPDDSDAQAFRNLVFRTEHYRQIYAAAMVEAGNPDAIYTTKSGIYQGALASIHGGGHKYDFCDKLLRDIPDFRMSTDKFLTLMASGEGWKFDEILDAWVDKILQPELPKVPMQEVLADVEARLWLTEWDGFLDESEDDEEDDPEDEQDDDDNDSQHSEQDEQPENGNEDKNEEELENASDDDLLSDG